MPESEEIKPANPENNPTKLELDLFFNYSLDLLVLVGFDNRFKQVSPSFERILGWKKEEVISKPFYNFLHPEDIEKTLAEVKTHETGKNAVLFENRYRCKDGSYKWISWNSHPLPEKQIIVGIGRDITDRKKVEETLKESEDRFRFALKNAPVSVAAQDRNLRYIWAYNQRTARPDEIIGKLDKEIFTPEEAAHFDQVKRRVIEENVELNEQMWFNRPSGRIFLDVTWSPIHDNNGKVIGVASATVDLTREKLAEKRLEESEERFRIIFENSRDGINMLDLKTGKYVFMNPAQVKLTGFNAEEINNISAEEAYDRTYPDDREITIAQQKKVVAGEDVDEPVEYRWRVKSGEYRWFSDSRKLVRDEHGQAIAMVGISRDITERKKAEEAVLQSEQRYRSLYGAIGGGVVVQDQNGSIIEANDVACELLGLTRDQMQGRTSTDPRWHAIHEDNSPFPGNEHPAMVTLRTGKPTQKVVMGVFHPNSDEYRWITINSEPIIDFKTKNVQAAVTTFVDITDRKKAEDALRLSEERFSKAFNLSPFAVIMTRLSDGTYVDVNETFLKMFEFSREEVIGHTANEIKIYAKPDGRAAYLAAFKNGRVSDFEVDLKTKTGKPIKALGYAEIINVNGQDLTFGTLVDITVRKKAEETLRKKQDELQTIIDSSQGLIFYKDNLNHFIQVNKAFAKTMGLPKEQLEGRSLFELYPKEEAEAFWSDDKQVIASGKAKVGIEEKMHSKHEQRWVQTDKIPYRDAEGNIIGVIGFSVDITERKKAEEELKKSEEHARQRAEELRKLMDIIPAAVWVSQDPECKVIVGNQAANTFYEAEGEENVSAGPAGGSAQDTTRRFFRNGKELIPQELPMQEAAAKNVEIKNSELEVVVPSGRKITIIGNAKPLLDDAGNVRGCLGAFVDITERKKAEEATERQAELIDLSPDAIIVRKLDGTITFWSKGAERLYGWTKEEAIGQDVNVLLKTQLPQSLKEIQNELKTKGTWSGEIVHICKDGNRLVMQSYWLAKLGSDGKIVEVLESNVDITVRIHMQLKLEESAVRLEEYATQMEELANQRAAQLKDSERLAAIGATAGMVGHDIRNPLQAITGDLYLAKTELAALPENEQKLNALESLEEIEHNIDYINKIVADLQDYARPLNPLAQETNIKSLFNEILAKNGIPKNIRLTIEVEDKAEKIMADPAYLKRIVANLTLNAVQAMPDGGKLTIRAYSDKQTNDVLITVKDTGVGIPEDIKPKLFTPMMTTKSKGQGFGLAVVKRMTEGLGGTVVFESTEGKGTTFIVRLPPQGAKR